MLRNATIELAGVITAIAAQPNCSEPPQDFADHTYLLTQIVLPFINGLEVDLLQLDYDAFDENDLERLRKQCHERDELLTRALRMIESISARRPCACGSVEFL